ncbi:MAG: hypothetical protein ACODAA_02735 [Gemmatimonadota bacterium]
MIDPAVDPRKLARRLVGTQQRKDLAVQAGIVSAALGEKGVPIGGVATEGLVEEVVDLAPTL